MVDDRHGDGSAGDRPREEPAGGTPSDDATEEYVPFSDPYEGPVDASPHGDPDRTVGLPRQPQPTGDETSILPSTDETAQLPPEGAAGDHWAGRAGVPPPRPDTPTEIRDSVPEEWREGQRTGPWWMPIVVGLVALLLLGALGYGIWLLMRDNEPGPTPTPSIVPTTASPSVTAPPTTAPPTTAPPSPTASALVTVPPVVGMTQGQAQAALLQVGLPFRLEFRQTSDSPANTVINANPGPGQQVQPGTRVTLVIAVSAPTTAPASPPTGEPSATTGPPS